MSTDHACDVCEDTHLTDDNEDLSERGPWSWWMSLTPPSNLGVVLGFVKPTPCYACQDNAEDVTA
jgi:hypothetical protein